MESAQSMRYLWFICISVVHVYSQSSHRLCEHMLFFIMSPTAPSKLVYKAFGYLTHFSSLPVLCLKHIFRDFFDNIKCIYINIALLLYMVVKVVFNLHDNIFTKKRQFDNLMI